MDKLTVKQERFVEEYLVNLNSHAGYSAECAVTIASRVRLAALVKVS